MRDIKIEAKLLENWKLKLGLAAAILSPAIAATSAYYNLKADYVTTVQAAEQRIEEKYVSKDAFAEMKDNVRDMKDDVRDIKKYMLQRSGRPNGDTR